MKTFKQFITELSNKTLTSYAIKASKAHNGGFGSRKRPTVITKYDELGPELAIRKIKKNKSKENK